jgi:hypothetical protein
VAPVVSLCEQCRAQHKRAVETSGSSFQPCAAFLQQSMPAICGMLHSCSLACRGMPEKTLPPITIISANDAKRFPMRQQIYGSPLTFVKEYLTEVKSRLLKFGSAPVMMRNPVVLLSHIGGPEFRAPEMMISTAPLFSRKNTVCRRHRHSMLMCLSRTKAEFGR